MELAHLEEISLTHLATGDETIAELYEHLRQHLEVIRLELRHRLNAVSRFRD